MYRVMQLKPRAPRTAGCPRSLPPTPKEAARHPSISHLTFQAGREEALRPASQAVVISDGCAGQVTHTCTPEPHVSLDTKRASGLAQRSGLDLIWQQASSERHSLPGGQVPWLSLCSASARPGHCFPRRPSLAAGPELPACSQHSRCGCERLIRLPGLAPDPTGWRCCGIGARPTALGPRLPVAWLVPPGSDLLVLSLPSDPSATLH